MKRGSVQARRVVVITSSPYAWSSSRTSNTQQSTASYGAFDPNVSGRIYKFPRFRSG